METPDCTCPFCNGDISEFVHKQIILYVRRLNAERMNSAAKNNAELKRKRSENGEKQLKKWHAENPDKAKASAARARAMRTPETFARQSESIKQTIIRKNVVFAELLAKEKEATQDVSPERLMELARQAASIVRAEKKRKK